MVAPATSATPPQYQMPSTPQGAPPSFYNQAAQMSNGAGAAQPHGQPQQPDPDTQKFVQMTDKLLTVLGAMQIMKPNGVDVTKYTQAAADSIKSCMEAVKTGEKQQPAGTTPAAADSGQLPGDQTGGDSGAAIAA